MSGDVLAMSDEDFLKLSEPPASAGGSAENQGNQETDEQRAAAEAAAATEAANQAAAEAEANAQAEADRLAAEEAAAKETSNGAKVAPEGEKAGNADESTKTTPPADQSGKEGVGAESSKKEDSSSGSTTEGQAEPPNYEEIYKKLMTPFKANGKMITLENPEEALQLMKMGANYTRKMQDMAPHRKVLLMLENNGMLDEGQLSFAIDLVKKKNPEAIKKLLKESGVDPLEIDTNTEPTYREGNHRVSDEEATFVSVLEDIKSTQAGVETLTVINSQWDQASKEVLWQNPEVIQVINEQRASGVYDRVAAEVERQKVLGQIAANVPFLQAYKAVGDQLASAGKLADLVPVQKPVTHTQAPVVTRAAAPKPVVKNSEKASAASATRSTPKTAEVKINPLAQSDEDFMKQMANRL